MEITELKGKALYEGRIKSFEVEGWEIKKDSAFPALLTSFELREHGFSEAAQAAEESFYSHSDWQRVLVITDDHEPALMVGRKLPKVFNGTPHKITIISEESAPFNPKLRKNVVTGTPEIIKEYPSNGILNAKLADQLEVHIEGVPVYKSVPVSVDPLPEGYDYYIVSMLYASAAKSTGADGSKLLITKNPVIASENDPTVVGCISFGRAF